VGCSSGAPASGGVAEEAGAAFVGRGDAKDRPLAYGVEFLRLERGSGHLSPRTN
jgi:hypothetical protein